jgi:hypothetical protein
MWTQYLYNVLSYSSTPAAWRKKLARLALVPPRSCLQKSKVSPKLENPAKALVKDFEELERRITLLEERNKVLEERNKVFEERNKVFEERNKVFEEHNKVLEEHNKVLEERNKVFEEHNKVLEEKNKELELRLHPSDNQCSEENHPLTHDFSNRISNKELIARLAQKKNSTNYGFRGNPN